MYDLSPCLIAGLVLFVGIPLSIAGGVGCSKIVKNCVRHRSRDFYFNSGLVGMALSAMIIVGLTAYNTRSVKPCGQDSLAKMVKGTPVQMLCDCGK